jgi:ribosomal protein L11 methyltransferase
MKQWLEISFVTTPAEAERLSDLLSGLGALSTTFAAEIADDAAEEEIFDTACDGGGALWGETRLIALFHADPGPPADGTAKAAAETTVTEASVAPPAAAILARLALALAPTPLPTHEARLIADRPWEQVWMADFVPIQVAPRLWICPTWHTPPDPEAINLLIDPGMAFGTGHHQTTVLCLRHLLELAAGPGGMAAAMVDYGCGSGILGIAAARLGCRTVYAYDIDPEALRVTGENAALNGVAEVVRLLQPQGIESAGAGLLVANILLSPLLELAPYFARVVRPGGRIALSGILASQVAACALAYEEYFSLAPASLLEDWALLSGTRRG